MIVRLLFFVASPAPSQSPVAVTVTVTSSTARISWSPPPLEAQNGIIRQYEIYLEDESSNFTFSSTKENYYLTDLLPATQYIVSVAAYTVEIGPKSDSTDFVTTEDGK